MLAYAAEVSAGPDGLLRVRVWAGDDAVRGTGTADGEGHHSLAFSQPMELAAKLTVALKEGIESPSPEYCREIR